MTKLERMGLQHLADDLDKRTSVLRTKWEEGGTCRVDNEAHAQICAHDRGQADAFESVAEELRGLLA